MRYVPLYLQVDGDDAVDASWDTAGFMLFDMMSGVAINGPFVHNIEGACHYVYCIFFDKLNLTAMYINTNIDFDNSYPSILLRYSRIQYGYNMFPFGPLTKSQILSYALYVTNNTIYKSKLLYKPSKLKNWYDGHYELDKSKVSAIHLRHVTRSEMLEFSWEEIQASAMWMFPMVERLITLGATESFVCGLLLWAMLLDDTTRQWISVSGVWHWRVDTIEGFLQQLKSDVTLR